MEDISALRPTTLFSRSTDASVRLATLDEAYSLQAATRWRRSEAWLGDLAVDAAQAAELKTVQEREAAEAALHEMKLRTEISQLIVSTSGLKVLRNGLETP